MKLCLSIGLVAVAALATPSAASSAVQPAPQPFSPIGGQSIRVDPVNGVHLVVRQTTANPVYVEAWRPGGTVLQLLARRTTDLSISQAQVGPVYFTPTAPDSLYSGQTGTVYWRPKSECFDESTARGSPCYGETQSFVYSLGSSEPTEPTQQCIAATQVARRALHRLKATEHRAQGGHTPPENRRLRRLIRQRAATYRRAKQSANVACP